MNINGNIKEFLSPKKFNDLEERVGEAEVMVGELSKDKKDLFFRKIAQEVYNDAINSEYEGDNKTAAQIYSFLLDLPYCGDFEIFAQRGLADSNFKQGIFADAIKSYEAIINNSDKRFLDHAWTIVARIYFIEGDLEESIFASNKAIQVNPKMSSAYLNLGLALEQKGLIIQSEIAYAKARKLDHTIDYLINTAREELVDKDKRNWNFALKKQERTNNKLNFLRAVS